jgi:hypothetical protein
VLVKVTPRTSDGLKLIFSYFVSFASVQRNVQSTILIKRRSKEKLQEIWIWGLMALKDDSPR